MLGYPNQTLFQENQKVSNSLSFPDTDALHDAVEEDLLQYFRDNPRANIRAAARDFGIRSHEDIWQPCHFHNVQYLLPADYFPRKQFTRWCLRQEQENIVFKSMFSSTTKSVSHALKC